MRDLADGFTPAADYENLLRQTRALAQICAGQEARIARLSEENNRLRRELALVDAGALESERATNERLTAALEAAEAKSVSLDLELHFLLDQWNGVVRASGSRTHGCLEGHAAAMRVELERLRKESC